MNRHIAVTGPWDEDHVKALLHFPRFPMRLIQQEPYQSWIGERGGLKAVQEYMREVPYPPSQRRILDVVLSNPEAIADVYADRLNISRATYFYQLRELVTTIFQSLNHWEIRSPAKRDLPIPQINLPAPLTSLVGVEATLHSLSRIFAHEGNRLLTLIGPGGIGKTRLSIELAHSMSCEACFVDLSELREPSGTAETIARAMGIPGGTIDRIITALQDREYILILDNFEQIRAASSIVTELLESLPLLRIIVTSRISLNLYGEHEFIVQPLFITGIDTVKDQQLWAKSPAVSLFVQRAQTVCSSFSLNNENVEDITELCQLLDGLPLAIELAAYQIKYSTPQSILTRLRSNGLTFFDHNAISMPPQQQTRRAAFDWSYQLLTVELQRFFLRLSAFEGSFSAKDVESVAPDADVEFKLAGLIDHSLLDQKPGNQDEPCYQMTHLTRDYARELSARQQES